MALWTLWEYVTAAGENQPGDWCAVQDEAVTAARLDVVRLIGNRPHWRKNPYYEDMNREHSGLGEIRIPVGSKDEEGYRRVRFFGFCYPTTREFLILVAFEKVRDGTLPPDAEALALYLKSEHEQGRGTRVKHEY